MYCVQSVINKSTPIAFWYCTQKIELDGKVETHKKPINQLYPKDKRKFCYIVTLNFESMFIRINLTFSAIDSGDPNCAFLALSFRMTWSGINSCICFKVTVRCQKIFLSSESVLHIYKSTIHRALNPVTISGPVILLFISRCLKKSEIWSAM